MLITTILVHFDFPLPHPRFTTLLHHVYSEGGRNIIKNFTIDQTFSTREEAEQAGLSFAQKWIDDGKPDLTP